MARGWSYVGQFICVFLTLSAIVSVPAVNADHNDDDDGDRDSSRCPKGFANFGDSRTDTGNALYVSPSVLDAENPPYGDTFFGRPAKRFSDGRLVPDFFCLAFEKRLLDPYFATTAFDYKDGINFAEAGAAASNIPAQNLISLPVQFNQFRRFLANVADTNSQNSCDDDSVPSGNSYTKWLYTITIGGNDILESLRANTPIATITSSVIPSAVAAISATIQGLYAQGARKFLIFGLPAEGCSTVGLTLLSTLPTDGLGCVVLVNQLAQTFNAQLTSAILGLRTNPSLSFASIAYFDYYSANIEILTNPGTYGFNPTLTKTACCGAPGVGTLNYNPAIPCGRPGSNKCANPGQYVNWDGIHFTEAFYRVISNFALAARFTDGGVNYTRECDLDFSKFGSSVTYQRVYPLECDTLFT